MKNHEIKFSRALNFVKQNFPKVSLVEDFKHQEQKGTYNPLTHQITLNEKFSHMILHELGHHITVSLLKIVESPEKST